MPASPNAASDSVTLESCLCSSDTAFSRESRRCSDLSQAVCASAIDEWPACCRAPSGVASSSSPLTGCKVTRRGPDVATSVGVTSTDGGGAENLDTTQRAANMCGTRLILARPRWDPSRIARVARAQFFSFSVRKLC